MNFLNSSFIGVNMYSIFLPSIGDLLHCKIEYLRFTYFSFSTGNNPHIETTWNPLVNLLEKRLNSLN